MNIFNIFYEYFHVIDCELLTFEILPKLNVKRFLFELFVLD